MGDIIPKGRLNIFVGSSRAGKTAKLLSRYRLAKEIYGDSSCCLVMFSENLPCNDCRKADCDHCQGIVVSSDGYLREPAIYFTTCRADLESNIPFFKPFLYIAIDNAHLCTDIDRMADCLATAGKVVDVAGHMGGAHRQPIFDMLLLLPKADSILHLRGRCSICRRLASFFSQEFIHIELYRKLVGNHPLCRACFYEKELGGICQAAKVIGQESSVTSQSE